MGVWENEKCCGLGLGWGGVIWDPGEVGLRGQGGGFVCMLFFLRTPQKMKNKIAWFDDQNAYMFIHAKGKKMFSQNHVHV